MRILFVCYKEVCIRKSELISFAKLLMKNFEINNLGKIKFYSGLEIDKNSRENYRICQSSYIQGLLRQTGLHDAKIHHVSTRYDAW